MNWIPELLAIANGDLTDERVLQRGRLLWENADKGTYIVDDTKCLNSVEELARYLHIGNVKLLELFDEADALQKKSFQYQAHIVKLNRKSDRKSFRHSRF